MRGGKRGGSTTETEIQPERDGRIRTGNQNAGNGKRRKGRRKDGKQRNAKEKGEIGRQKNKNRWTVDKLKI